jgi:hypothetical protein
MDGKWTCGHGNRRRARISDKGDDPVPLGAERGPDANLPYFT